MYFVYALILLLVLIVLHINVKPFKKTAVVWYSSVDPVFLLLMCYVHFNSRHKYWKHVRSYISFGNGYPWAFDSIYPNHLHHVSYVALGLFTKAMGNQILKECHNMQETPGLT